jgi:Rrf2 family protein
MRLTRKSCYGLRALSYVANQPEERYCPVEEIGRCQGIPGGFLAKVLTELVRGGLLVSRRGQEGGVRLARPASEITMYDVIQVLEGPLAISRCLNPGSDCPWTVSCSMKQVWQDLQETLASHLDSVSLAVMEPVEPEVPLR